MTVFLPKFGESGITQLRCHWSVLGSASDPWTRSPFSRRWTTRECVYLITLVGPFAAVTLILSWWPWYMKMTLIFWRRSCIPKLKFPGQGFQKLEHKQDRHTARCNWTRYQPHLEDKQLMQVKLQMTNKMFCMLFCSVPGYEYSKRTCFV